MGRRAFTEPQFLYKSVLYLFTFIPRKNEIRKAVYSVSATYEVIFVSVVVTDVHKLRCT